MYVIHIISREFTFLSRLFVSILNDLFYYFYFFIKKNKNIAYGFSVAWNSPFLYILLWDTQYVYSSAGHPKKVIYKHSVIELIFLKITLYLNI